MLLQVQLLGSNSSGGGTVTSSSEEVSVLLCDDTFDGYFSLFTLGDNCTYANLM